METGKRADPVENRIFPAGSIATSSPPFPPVWIASDHRLNLHLMPTECGVFLGHPVRQTQKRMQYRKRCFLTGCFAAGLIAAVAAGNLSGQSAAAPSSGALPEPLNWTTQQDHQNMK